MRVWRNELLWTEVNRRDAEDVEKNKGNLGFCSK